MMTTETQKILARLSAGDVTRLKKSAEEAQRLENVWRGRAGNAVDIVTLRVIDHLNRYGALLPDEAVRFDELFLEHSFAVIATALESANSDFEKQFDPASKLAAPKRALIPSSLRELIRMWDAYRARGSAPPRAKQDAKTLKAEYLKRIHAVWKRHSEGFRAGDTYTQEAVRAEIAEVARVTKSRAGTIVNTETGHYYNATRKSVYDRSEDVTHYLFLAIRDAATTKWCKTRTGVVFKKGTDLLEANVPPVHWNCRSEILPLSPSNPRHAALIADPTLKAERRVLAPLPAGWRRSA